MVKENRERKKRKKRKKKKERKEINKIEKENPFLNKHKNLLTTTEGRRICINTWHFNIKQK